MTCATTSRDMFVNYSSALKTTNCHHCSDYIPLVNLIGVFYQIRDDYSNLASKEVFALFRDLHHTFLKAWSWRYLR